MSVRTVPSAGRLRCGSRNPLGSRRLRKDGSGRHHSGRFHPVDSPLNSNCHSRILLQSTFVRGDTQRPRRDPGKRLARKQNRGDSLRPHSDRYSRHLRRSRWHQGIHCPRMHPRSHRGRRSVLRHRVRPHLPSHRSHHPRRYTALDRRDRIVRMRCEVPHRWCHRNRHPRNCSSLRRLARSEGRGGSHRCNYAGPPHRYLDGLLPGTHR